MTPLEDCIPGFDPLLVLFLAALAVILAIRVLFALLRTFLPPFRFRAPVSAAVLIVVLAILATSVSAGGGSPVLIAKKECLISRMAIQVQWDYRTPPPRYQQPGANTSRDKSKVSISRAILAGPEGVTKAQALQALAYVVKKTPTKYRSTTQFEKAETKAREYIVTSRGIPSGASKSFNWVHKDLKNARIDVVNFDGRNNLRL